MSQLIPLNDQTFDELATRPEGSSIVFFYAPWSKPCEPTSEVLAELAKTFDQRLSFFCMNIDENANIPASFGVQTIPSILALKNGRIVSRLSGRNPKVKIREFVERVDNGSESP